MIERGLHGPGDRGAVGSRRGHMVGVACQAVPCEFAIDCGTASLCVFVFFKHENAGTLSHDKSVPVAIKRTGSFFRFVVASTHGSHRTKTRYAQGADNGFASSGKKNFSFSVTDQTPRFSD